MPIIYCDCDPSVYINFTKIETFLNFLQEQNIVLDNAILVNIKNMFLAYQNINIILKMDFINVSYKFITFNDKIELTW